MRLVLVLVPVLAALPAAALEFVRPTAGQVAAFQRADVDGSASVSLDEAQVIWPDMTARELGVHDANRDGGIDVFEFTSVRSAGPVVEPGDAPGTPRVDEAALEFRQLDLDRSGGLSPAEVLEKYPEAAASFGSLDLDGDGILSEAEFTGEAAAR